MRRWVVFTALSVTSFTLVLGGCAELERALASSGKTTPPQTGARGQKTSVATVAIPTAGANAPAHAALSVSPPPPLVPTIASAATPEPIPEVEDTTPEPPPGPELVSILKETWIYSAPQFKSQKLGYLRAGAKVDRSEKPVGFGSCEGGWYKIAPKGFVCVGTGASLDLDNPIAELAKRRPDRKAGLPYVYGMSKYPTPPFYLKLPTTQEQAMVEPDLDTHLHGKKSSLKVIPLADGDELPGALLYGRIVPSLTPNHHGPGALYAGRAVPKSGFAMISEFTWDDRRWGLTTDFQIVPLDRMKILEPSHFHGIELAEGVTLPVAFERSKSAHAFTRDPKTGALTEGHAIGYREAIPLTGKSFKIDGTTYLEARDGTLIHNENLVRLEDPKEWPSWANEGKKWIDVSILEQSLVAYDGKKAVYATLVSTGADGLGDPKETHSTVRGAFLIHTKHVTVTMDNDEADDRFDLRDVPYVQYFHEGYALHAAYWHDDFGHPHSHGCINMHPTDAAWLFGFTDPQVPEGWHAALSAKAGTVVSIHP